jgi:hypothetical protein
MVGDNWRLCLADGKGKQIVLKKIESVFHSRFIVRSLSLTVDRLFFLFTASQYYAA